MYESESMPWDHQGFFYGCGTGKSMIGADDYVQYTIRSAF